MASGEFDCSRAAAKGVSERSIPVFFVYSAKAASMINWTLEVEKVACPVEDMPVIGFRVGGNGMGKERTGVKCASGFTCGGRRVNRPRH